MIGDGLTSSRCNMRRATIAKAALLAHGVTISPATVRAFAESPYLAKQRAYGNPDAEQYLDVAIPQELYLVPNDIVVSVNAVMSSPFALECRAGEFVVASSESEWPVTFPVTPGFYHERLQDGRFVSDIATLYGGSSLGIFANGGCDLVERNAACQYCSIEPNRSVQNRFPRVVTPGHLVEAIRIALTMPGSELISQIMLNGGNFPDADRSFGYYCTLAEAAREVVDDVRPGMAIHLIAYPPRDHSLFRRLQGLNVQLAINFEVFDPSLFAQYCPGKHTLTGQAGLLKAIEAAASTLGDGQVFSICVGGLEPLMSLEAGVRHVATLGATPVINVFHPDPGTPLASRARPSVMYIITAGQVLQDVYDEYHCDPFYLRCGRNAIDSEAHWQLF